MTIHRINPLTTAFSICFAAAIHVCGSALAGEAPGKVVLETAKEKSCCDKIWEYPTIYKNDESSFFNEFRFVGRIELGV